MATFNMLKREVPNGQKIAPMIIFCENKLQNISSSKKEFELYQCRNSRETIFWNASKEEKENANKEENVGI